MQCHHTGQRLTSGTTMLEPDQSQRRLSLVLPGLILLTAKTIPTTTKAAIPVRKPKKYAKIMPIPMASPSAHSALLSSGRLPQPTTMNYANALISILQTRAALFYRTSFYRPTRILPFLDYSKQEPGQHHYHYYAYDYRYYCPYHTIHTPHK